jgi:protein gp37
MSEKTNIAWTDATWNIARGCTKVDEDCKYCYMYRDSFDSTRYDPLQVVRTKTVFNLPLKLKEPSKIFTCSLTDFFHEAIDRYRNEAWGIIRKCPQHTFQILTKRPERILKCLPEDFGAWGSNYKNVWFGTSVGSSAGLKRIADLMDAKMVAGFENIIFASLEPLHGRINLMDEQYELFDIPMLHYLNWIIVGGESGNETGKYKYRPCQLEWIEKIVSDCKNGNVPVFVKQMGTYLSKELHMSDRHGGNIDEFPKQLQIREFPKNGS